jgi:hypothetical protein
VSARERATPLLTAWILALIAAAVALSMQPIRESDAFWHMSLGRAVLESGSRTVPEVSAVAAFSDDAMVPEWLWGVATYALHEAGGPVALSLLVLLLAACAAAAIALLLRRAVPKAPPAAFVLISAWSLRS